MRPRWMRALGMAVVPALVALSPIAVHAAANDLFSPLDKMSVHGSSVSLDPSFQALADSPATATLQLVHANAGVVTEKADTLRLNLGQGLDLVARRLDSKVTNEGHVIWSGVILNTWTTPFRADKAEFDPANSILLVRDGDTITGNVHVNAEWYKIRPLRTGAHAIVLVDPGSMPPDHPAAAYKNLPVIKMPVRPVQVQADTPIRVMVHYTPSAASASGNISSLIDLAVAESNQGYTNSGVLIDLFLATKAQVSYTESSSFSTDLSRYRGTSDGYMDSIHTTRNSVAADVGVLLINNASSCGLASSIGSTASTAFATAHWDCATGYYSFAHEIGHLQSARHDPATDPTTTPYAYGHGYRNGNSWRTIMAYNCTAGCPRLNYWSNPSKLYGGVPMGTSSTSDNTRVLNNTRGTVSAFR
ncbi:MAG: M12 family metallo-peptidase [Acidobacteriota bacterium]